MKKAIYILSLVTIVCGCANRGMGPQGGPKDTIPPVIVTMIPQDGSTQFNAKRIELQFNEYLQLDNVVENVVLSPPTKQAPEVRAVGKKVFVTFLDTLKDSTTYTLDFGNAICDYTEKIPVQGFSYRFSTGDVLDSMVISGRVVNSADLNPISGIVVGLHADVHDSAFATSQFDNIGKTDTLGLFEIRNIRPGRYRIYALGDVSRDNLYQPGEGLAFSDLILETTIEIHEVYDTIWKNVDSISGEAGDTLFMEQLDSVSGQEIDSIIHRIQVEKGPRDLVLWYFNEDKVRRYFQRAYRDEAHLIKFIFSGAQDEKPSFRALRPSTVDSSYQDNLYVDWMPYTRWNYNKTNDTILVWLTDSIAIQQDSMFVEVTYQKTDSLYNLVSQTDTLRCIYRAPRLTEKMAETKARQAENRKVEIKCNANGKFGIGKAVELTMSMPLDTIIKDSITLWRKEDTTFVPLEYELKALDSTGLKYEIVHKWKSEPYEIRIDSAAVRDIYEKVNNKSKIQFTIRSVEEYATLTVTMLHYDSNMVVQLLDSKGDPTVNSGEWVKNGNLHRVLFKNIEPKDYYLRMFIDENGDGKWTTGDWMKKQQPEPVYYFNKKLTFKANWDFEEEWDYLAFPQLGTKPSDLVKDAAQQKKK